MIVDCHTHVHTSNGQPDAGGHLSAAQDVDISIVLAEPCYSSDQANDQLCKYIGEHDEQMIGFALVNPLRENISSNSLKSLLDHPQIRGFVIYCSQDGFHPAHSRAMQFYETAAELQVPVFFHNSAQMQASAALEFAQPYLLDEIARAFPSLKIIIGNMGLPFIQQTLSLVAKHTNVLADLTISPRNVWQVFNTVLYAFEYKVMDKLVFGSGFPVNQPSECIETLLGFNKLLADTKLPTVPRGAIRQIVEGDSLQLLGISD